MGVKELWPAVESVMEVKSFDGLRGQTIAVDLSMWIVDSQCVKQMAGVVVRPHLRNLFFRVSAMLHAGILPVFVVEGKAPELKWQTMADRQNARTGTSSTQQTYQSTDKQANRKNFNSVIKECVEMLDYLGIPHLQASGEAEALCAALNRAGLVDAVITEDGDAFLYGARIVYKNFTTTKTPSVESYSMYDIEKQTGLYREHLIALALLVGCDYCPKGVPGVGKIQALKLCQLISHHQILNRLKLWSSRGVSGVAGASERTIAQKISRMNSTNFNQIIQEFMNEACKLPSSVGTWRKPLISKAQTFNLDKLEWPINYSLDKMLPLVTLWGMTMLHNDTVCGLSRIGVEPKKVVKKRVRQGLHCLEVLWTVTDPYEVDEEDDKQPSFTTIEPLDRISGCYPDIVEQFQLLKIGKSKKTTATKNSHPISKCNIQTTVADCSSSNYMEDLQYSFTQLATQDRKSVDDVATNSHSDIGEVASKFHEMISDSVVMLASNSVTSDGIKKAELCNQSEAGALLSNHFVSQDSKSNQGSKSIPVVLLNDSGVSSHHSDCNATPSDNESTNSSLPVYKLNGSVCCSPHSELTVDLDILPGQSADYSAPKLLKAIPRNSLDALLADISRDLNSPGCNNQEVSHMQSPRDYKRDFLMDSLNSDSIITGYVTPDHNLISADADCGSAIHANVSERVTDSIYLPEANSTISLFDVKSEANSDISLFDVRSSIADQTQSLLSSKRSSCSRLTDSSPLLKSNGKNTNITPGNFDIVPDLSALNLTD